MISKRTIYCHPFVSIETTWLAAVCTAACFSRNYTRAFSWFIASIFPAACHYGTYFSLATAALSAPMKYISCWHVSQMEQCLYGVHMHDFSNATCRFHCSYIFIMQTQRLYFLGKITRYNKWNSSQQTARLDYTSANLSHILRKQKLCHRNNSAISLASLNACNS